MARGHTPGRARTGHEGRRTLSSNLAAACLDASAARTRWVGRIVVELTLTEPRTGAVLWTEQFDETEPLTTQTPEGLARALSVALARIAARTAPRVDALATAAARRLGDGAQLGRVLNDGRERPAE